MEYLASRFKKLRSVSDHVVTNFLFEKDKIYAYLNLTDPELELYNEYYSMFREELRSPDLVIYLQSDADSIRSNIRRSQENAPISNDYVGEVVRAYDHFFQHYVASDLMVVDVRNLKDFTHFEGALRRLSQEQSKGNPFMRAGEATA